MEKCMRKNKRFKQFLLITFMLVCLSGIIYSSYHIFIWGKSVDSNKVIMEELNGNVIVKEEEKYAIDFSELKNQNSDTVAYIKVNGTNIDHVVLKGNDNDYYLRHNFKKEWNIAGWIFMDYKNKLDGTDKNIVIFGHNMSDGSMFGSLKNVLYDDWHSQEENLIITLITEKKEYKYKVFSTYNIEREDYYIKTDFDSYSDFDYFLNTVKARSNYDYGVDVDIADQILTLSTCSAAGARRTVLHAKKI